MVAGGEARPFLAARLRRHGVLRWQVVKAKENPDGEMLFVYGTDED